MLISGFERQVNHPEVPLHSAIIDRLTMNRLVL